MAPNSVSAVTSNQSATVTVGSDALHVVIPSVNIDASFPIPSPPNLQIPNEFALSYVALGQWYGKPNSAVSCNDCATSSGGSLSVGVFGFETPATAMPTSGSANYAGAGAVRGTVFFPDTGGIFSAPLTGDANLSVNFATGSISGGFKNMKAIDPCFGPSDWNDVSVNASIASGTNKFSGSTAAGSPSQNSYYGVKGSATGTINGAFYGPAAQNIGAIWTLSDGTKSALGGVAAGH